MNELEDRIEKIRRLNTDHIQHFQYSKLAKIPFKVHSFIEIMSLRMLDFSEAAFLLIENDHVIPSLPIIRALFENIAIVYRIKSSIDKSLEENKLDNGFDDLITKIVFGTRDNDEILAINILTQIDKLDKEYSGIRKFYDSISEFVHPNCDGVLGSYSELNEEDYITEVIKVITVKNPIYKWIEACFLLILGIYLEYYNRIKSDLPRFASICELEIINKLNNQA
jgi:hypothetical protein